MEARLAIIIMSSVTYECGLLAQATFGTGLCARCYISLIRSYVRRNTLAQTLHVHIQHRAQLDAVRIMHHYERVSTGNTAM